MPAASSDSCRWGEIYRAVRPSVVMIESTAGRGTGFVFHSNRYVATAFHVVSITSGLKVIFANGVEMGAKVVAADQKRDLALLELDREVEARPLEPLQRDLEVGEPLAALGHPFYPGDSSVPEDLRGLMQWSLSVGHVSTGNDWLVQYDTPTNHGNSGGPVLACDGKVAGVVSRKYENADGIGWAVRMRHLSALVDDLGKQPEYRGSVDLSWNLSARMQQEQLSWAGFAAGVGMKWDAHLELQASLLALTTLSRPQPVDGFAGTASRFGLEGTLRYRLLLPALLRSHLTLGASALLAADSAPERHFRIQAQEPCSSAECTPTLVSQESTAKEVRLLWGPTASIILGGSLELGYSLLFQKAELDQLTHQAVIGLSF